MKRVIIFVTCIQQILCHRICKLRKRRRGESARPGVFLNKLRFKSIFLLFRFFGRKLSGAPPLSPHSLPEAWPPTNGLLGNSRSFQHSLQICKSVFQELKHRCRSHGIGKQTRQWGGSRDLCFNTLRDGCRRDPDCTTSPTSPSSV